MTDHKVRVYDTAGVLQYELTDFLSLSTDRTVNASGMATLELSGYHTLLKNIQDKWQLEYWRQPDGQSWYREFAGIYRKSAGEYVETPRSILAIPGIASMLGWRVVAWYANTDNRSKFLSTKGETIMKTLVNYNAGAFATVVNGRWREGAITGLSVQTDGATGNTIDWFCAFDNLLSTLQDLARVTGGDFDLVKTSSTTYEFRWYVGRLGTDRRTTVLFALERGNMEIPVYEDNYINQATVAIVGGKGEDSARAHTTRTSADYHVTNNNIEVFVNATQANTGSGLQSKGDEVLATMSAIRKFSFNIIQTPSAQYGVHYFLGDLVSGINPYSGVKAGYKIIGASIALPSKGKEKISIKLVRYG
jgi:hypothetical protein